MIPAESDSVKPDLSASESDYSRPTVRGKGMRTGYTTGACATAASKAAVTALLTGQPLEKITIHLPMGEDATKGRRTLGCFSISFLLGGLLSLLIFFATCERPEPIYYDNTPYFELQGYPIPVDSNDTATPLFDARGRVVPAVKSGPDTFPVSSVSGEETEISFTNRMEFHVRVYRIDANGSALHLNYLEQNQGSLPMKTYAGQTWLVTNYVGRPIFYFIAEKGMEGEVGWARILPDNWEDR